MSILCVLPSPSAGGGHRVEPGLLLYGALSSRSPRGAGRRVLTRYLHSAITAYTEVLRLLPQSPAERAVARHQLGIVYCHANGREAVANHLAAVRLAEPAEAVHGAAVSRDVAAGLLNE